MNDGISLSSTCFLSINLSGIAQIAKEHCICAICSKNHNVATGIRFNIVNEGDTLANLLLCFARPRKQQIALF